MKRIASIALAAATFIAPMSLAGTAAADPPRHHDRGDRNDHRGDYRNDRRDRDYDNRDDRRDERRAERRGYRQGRWDAQQYNGYEYRGRWYYGPPPAAYSDYRPGYRNWRRGDRLPSYYRDAYRPVDYRHAHLRAPPRGYHYVQDDRGQTLLVGIATGVILGVILGNN